MLIANVTAIAIISPYAVALEPPDRDTSVSELSAQICPEDDELQWLKIPWRVSFWQGVRDSQIDGKPILLWAMNGHPLGCT